MTPDNKLRVYLETSVWNVQFADDSPQRQKITWQLFEQIRQGRFETYVSDLVIDEIQDAPEPRHSELIDLVREISPSALELTTEVIELSEKYLQSGMLSEKHKNDALHIAIAVVNGLDLLLSWNFKHIVKPKTRRIVSGMTRMIGYREIEICSPEEVIYDGARSTKSASATTKNARIGATSSSSSTSSRWVNARQRNSVSDAYRRPTSYRQRRPADSHRRYSTADGLQIEASGFRAIPPFLQRGDRDLSPNV